MTADDTAVDWNFLAGAYSHAIPLRKRLERYVFFRAARLYTAGGSGRETQKFADCNAGAAACSEFEPLTEQH